MPADDRARATEALVRLLTDRHSADLMGHRGRELVREKYEWPRVIDTLELGLPAAGRPEFIPLVPPGPAPTHSAAPAGPATVSGHRLSGFQRARENRMTLIAADPPLLSAGRPLLCRILR